MNEKKEIWKTYPEFDFIQGSNFGRIRTIDQYIKTKNGKRLIKGHILKQWYNENGYFLVSFSVNGRKANRRVHRIVAECFLPNPDNLPQVNHKNCIRDDNRVVNLEWCSASYNCQYREKYGVSSTEARGHPLFAVNLETQKELYFHSQIEAERELGVDVSNISGVIKGKRQQAGGYYFTEDESKITERKLRKIKANMLYRGGVIAINFKTQKVYYFQSQSKSANELKLNVVNINNVLAGRAKQTHDYWFTHANEKVVEATRTKFGDNVAEKVAQLMKKIKNNLKNVDTDEYIC